MESEVKAERQQLAAFHWAENGQPPAGVRLTGYTMACAVVEHEAAVVRQLFTRFHAGDSLRGILTWLTEHAVPTGSGRPRSPSGVEQTRSDCDNDLIDGARYQGEDGEAAGPARQGRDGAGQLDGGLGGRGNARRARSGRGRGCPDLTHRGVMPACAGMLNLFGASYKTGSACGMFKTSSSRTAVRAPRSCGCRGATAVCCPAHRHPSRASAALIARLSRLLDDRPETARRRRCRPGLPCGTVGAW
jgi:hypothetical protein